MQLKYIKTVAAPSDGAAKIAALAWSPNSQKLAVASADRHIILFDENGEKKDKFATKPIDAKYGKKSYVVRALAFSPDSTKLAVGQTDQILFVYKIGDGWNEKKVICNKFAQQSAVTCLCWPLIDQGLVVGLADGKVRLANVKTNKANTLYNTDVHVTALCISPNGKGFLSSHGDGSIVRYFFDNEGSGEPQGKLCQHPCPPSALAWTQQGVLAAGCDKRVCVYSTQNGSLTQQFDYSREETEREFTCATVSPSGQNVVLGSYDHLRVLNWNNRRGAWEEGKTKEIPYMYTVSTVAWKPDGSKVVCGALCGNVEMFDCALKRSLIRNKFETTHVGASQVIVKDVTTGKRAVVRSEYGYDIDEVKVMGHDRYVVAHTAESLLFADLENGMTSEVPWRASGNEKFYFDSENVAMVFNAGELTLIEYGANDILGSVRTEFMNPHLISVRLNERQHKHSEEIKRIAYLIDIKTINILDLRFGSNIGQIAHDSKIDWLEMNETGKKLLFRDKRYRLNLFNIETDERATLLNYCSYVQWVPGSDVAVAQNRDNLCVWYNIDTADRVTMFPIKGDVLQLIRDNGQTDVIVQEGNTQAAYTLDEGLIEFGTAMEDGDLGRAVSFLEQLDTDADTDAMWIQLANTAIEQRQLHVAQRCYAALGDVSKARYLERTIKIAKQAAKQIGGDGTQHYGVRARLAIMNKQFKDAERIYLEQNCLDEAIEMYQSLHKWDEALELAEAKSHPDLESLKARYYRHLADSGQDEKAAEIKEKENDYLAAIDLYLKANLPAKAARVISEQDQYLTQTDLVQSVAIALIKNELFEKAGELFEKVKDFERALECYRKANAFSKAVELSRYSFPEEVVKLEEEWGDHLAKQKHMDQAINHYIESGATLKALEAAIGARQWTKAVQIVDVVDTDTDEAKRHFGTIARHYAANRDYDRAERFFIEAGLQKEAILMYNNAGQFQAAHRLASEFMHEEEATEMYLTQARELEQKGQLKQAEDLYIAIGQANKAIAMYKQAGEHDSMMRLIGQYHSEHVDDTHVILAKELEEQGRLPEAELHYVQANEWKSAVSMYRAVDNWEDAYRVAKTHGGGVAQRQVAYLWAKSLGGDSAVKLLQKFNLLQDAIDYASDNGAFDFAFELCRLGLKEKQPEVHLKYALQLEEDGQMAQAEQQFLSADKAKEAVLMYVHQQDWDNAQRLAESHCPESITEVYIGQARVAFEQQDYAKAESYLLRAQKPEIIVKSYKEIGMWTDALRVCKEYLPNLLPKLQDEYDQEQLKSGAKGADSYLAQAKEWESQGEYDRAIVCYLKINKPLTTNDTMMEKAWNKAGDLALKFLPEDQAVQVVQSAAELLIENRKFNSAADLLLQAGLAREAIDALISAGDFPKAKKIAVELGESDLEAYVDDRYKNHLKNEGNTDQLADVDVISAIEMLIEKGQWTKALDTALQQNNPALLDKYVARYATELIGVSKFTEAVDAFEKYGASANRQNFNVYKRLIDETIARRDTFNGDSYPIWKAIRNMLLSLMANLKEPSAADDLDPRYVEVFDRYLLISHYYAARSAFLKAKESDPVFGLFSTKLTISLVRHCDLILADKTFYEAGIACRDYGGDYENMAFVFLNHYLDLTEAIEEQNPDRVDSSQFDGTDIPSEFPLPEQLYLTEDEHEEVKDWVLSVSVDQQLDRRQLKQDARGAYEASTVAPNGSTANACIVTGYPMLDAKKTFGNSPVAASRDDWNKLIVVQKTAKIEEIDDVQKFIASWTNGSIGMAL